MVYHTLFQLVLTILLADSLSVTSLPSTRTPPTRRKQSSLTYDPLSNSLFIYGGYHSADEYFDDMWRFDLNSNTWEEILSPSSLTPGPRIDAHMKVLNGSKTILLYGGTTLKGPIADIWLFDIQNYMWQPVYYRGLIPAASHTSGGVFFEKDFKEYFACYSGTSREGVHNKLYILDISTFTWTEAEYNGITPPKALMSCIEYHNGAIYLYGGFYGLFKGSRELYRYELETKTWSVVSVSGEKPPALIGFMSYVYKDYLYLSSGFEIQEHSYLESIWRISLYNPVAWERIEYASSYPDTLRAYVGKFSHNGTIYMFGGYTISGFKNDLAVLNLGNYYIDDDKLAWKILSKDMNVPTPRLGHAMDIYDGNIFIYGGKNKEGYNMIDVWRYDIKNEVWSPYLIISPQPEARSEFAYTRNGDSFIIYGGQGDEGLLDDMYLMHIRFNTWHELIPRSSIKPVARKGACMAVSGYTIFIFGGKTSSGYSNEIWTFDLGTQEYSLITARGEVPHMSYSKCNIITKDDQSKLFVSFGESIGIRAMSGVYVFDIADKKWSVIRDNLYDDISRSEASVLLLDNKILVAGGHEDGVIAHNEIYELDLTTDTYEQVGQLPTNIISAGSAYHKNSFYIHGGSYSFGALAIRNIPTNNLYMINLNESCDHNKETCNWPCSKGTFLNSDSVCEPCLPGTYSEQEGNISCSKCHSGYYLRETSADAFNQCSLCDKGTYNPLEGQRLCKDCEYAASCPIGSTEPILTHIYNPEFSSVNPKLYESSSLGFIDNQDSLWLYLSIIQLFILIILLIIPKTRRFLKKADIYKAKHKYSIRGVVYRSQTLFGGVFTFMAISIIFTIILHSSLEFSLHNIRETKTLIPNVSVEKEYDKFISDMMIFEYTFKNYGGKCGYDNRCIDQIEIVPDNLIGDFHTPTCSKFHTDCYVTVNCTRCELNRAARLELILNENLSFATELKVRVTSSSSIPNATSSISTSITHSGNTILRGIDPTVVHLLMTPSLFLSEVNRWPDEGTGYHISEIEEPTLGTVAEISEVPFTKSLKVVISMELNDYVLMTERFHLQSYFMFMSSLAGSVLGIIGVVGFLMRLSEKYYIKYGNRVARNKLIHIRREEATKIKHGFPGGLKHKDSIQIRKGKFKKRSIDSMLGSDYCYNIHESTVMNSSYQNFNGDTPYNSILSSQGKDSVSMSFDLASAQVKQEITHIRAKYLYHDEEEVNQVVKHNKVAPIV